MTIAVRRGGALRYTHTDHLGSSSGQTDTSGNAIAASYLRYYAYGGLRSGIISASSTDRTFTGQKQDGTGLLYYNARYYDSTLGVFLSPDTLVPDASRVVDYNRFLYVQGNPLRYNDPTGHCPKPPSSTANTICIAGFIPTQVSEGAPGGMILYQADNRDFSSDSTGQSSRFYVWLNADTGEFISDPKEFVHPTVQLAPAWKWAGGGEHQPRDSHNYFFARKSEDGSIYFTYSVVCAGPNCLYAPGPEGEIVFAPNDSGSYDVFGSVEAFPNLEAYHWQNGELVSPQLFQLQNFSQKELESGKAAFGTGLNMYDWLPGGHRDFQSHTQRGPDGRWHLYTQIEKR